MDWAPVFISFVLFIFLSPGLLFQIPGKSRVIECGNFQTSAVSILVHTILFFVLDAVFLVAIGVRMELGPPSLLRICMIEMSSSITYLFLINLLHLHTCLCL